MMPSTANLSLYDFSSRFLDSPKPIKFSQFKGSPIIIANVACKCALTKTNYTQFKKVIILNL